jgi:hypothetical protein
MPVTVFVLSHAAKIRHRTAPTENEPFSKGQNKACKNAVKPGSKRSMVLWKSFAFF